MVRSSIDPMSDPQISIDPRIDARRAAVLRAQGRRRLNLMASLVVVGALVAVTWLSLQSPFLDLDHIRVQPLVKGKSTTHLLLQTVEQASGLRRGEPLFKTDLAFARRGVLALPWVKDVEVTKEWPGTVTLKVSERVPVAGVRAIGSGWMLVDQEGHQLEVIPDMVPGVVPVEGTMPVGKPGKIVESDGLAALALVEALDPTLRASVMRVVFSEGPSLVAVLRPGEGGEEVEVRFGSPVDLKMKAVDLSTILANVDIRDIAVLDVRVPGTPAVIRGR